MSKRSSESEIKDFKIESLCLFFLCVCVCVLTFLFLNKIRFFENFNLTFVALFCYKTKLKVFRYSFSEAIPIFFNRLKSDFFLVRSL